MSVLLHLSHRLDVAIMERAAIWDRDGTWRDDGSKAAWARLSRDARIAPATARRVLRRANQLTEMPATAAALHHGTLSGDHVDEPATDPRTLTITAGIGDEVRVEAMLDAVRGAEFAAALDRIDKELELADRNHPGWTTRSRRQRRADFDSPTHAIAATNRRTFTGALRRAIEVRDRHCQHPSGCDEPINRGDIDHITPRPPRRSHHPIQRAAALRRSPLSRCRR